LITKLPSDVVKMWGLYHQFLRLGRVFAFHCTVVSCW